MGRGSRSVGLELGSVSSSSSSSSSSSASGWSGSSGLEEEVAQAHRGVLAAHRPALPAGEVLEVGGLLAEDAEQGLAPGVVAAEGVVGVLGHPLDGEPEEVDPVARREVELQGVGLLEEVDGQGQQLGRRRTGGGT